MVIMRITRLSCDCYGKCRFTALNTSNLSKAISPFIREKDCFMLARKRAETYNFRLWQAMPSHLVKPTVFAATRLKLEY
jgi:hypothetical protein